MSNWYLAIIAALTPWAALGGTIYFDSYLQKRNAPTNEQLEAAAYRGYQDGLNAIFDCGKQGEKEHGFAIFEIKSEEIHGVTHNNSLCVTSLFATLNGADLWAEPK